MIATAASQLGYHEGRDSSGWNNDTFFGSWYGLNGQAWCAIYQSWCAAHSGCAGIIPRGAYTPSMGQWFHDHNQWGGTPRVGALGFLGSASLQGSRWRGIHHVFLVEKVLSDGTFLTLEGNTNNDGSSQGDGVYRLKRSGVGTGGFGYPNYLAAPHIATPAAAPRRPSVSLVAAQDMGHRGVFTGPVGDALKAEKLPATRSGYADYQKRLGYTGTAADGIPGPTSLKKLGAAHGFDVA
jgi:hypothetical protein